MKQPKCMPVGVDDFRDLRKRYYFVDKTKFIQELIDGHSKVTLITRPRRFGKTLTMSMLYYFFTNENAAENRKLFDDCAIAEAGEMYMAEQGTRPVVFFSLKDVKAANYASMMETVADTLREIYRSFLFLLDSDSLIEEEKETFRQILRKKASESDMQSAIKVLTQHLERHYHRKALLLIDEYDAPIQSAWEYGYYEKAIVFFRNFLSAALKSNPALDFAILTGVTRISKESIFSALNNLKVSSVIRGSYANVMGFTSEETGRMAEDLGYTDKLEEIREWYDGYNFSGQDVYNPWSVVRYFDEGCVPDIYWANTSGNGILADMLENINEEQEKNLYRLLQMESISTRIKENIVYSDIRNSSAALYTMLLTTGYLKIVPGVFGDDTEYCTVAIPNKEIRKAYASEIVERLGRVGTRLDSVAFLENLLTGRAEEFSEELSRYVENMVSYYDTANREGFYHGFMLGIMAVLVSRYHVRSNRESGYGRFDLAIFPKHPRLAGVLMEFKVAETEADLEREAIAALKQIEDMDYMAEFRAQGIDTVWKYGIAFCGKKLKLMRG